MAAITIEHILTATFHFKPGSQMRATFSKHGAGPRESRRISVVMRQNVGFRSARKVTSCRSDGPLSFNAFHHPRSRGPSVQNGYLAPSRGRCTARYTPSIFEEFRAMTTPTVLERKTMGTPSLTVFALAASALMVVLVGSIPATYASTGVLALPLLFLLVGAVIALLSVGYTAMARRVRHPAVYYAAIAHGLGRPMGLAGGLVALLAYNAILISQFGLFGFTAANLFGFGPWWFWALVAAAIVALFGVRHIAASTI